MLEQALARMLDLGYGVKQSELALFRAGGDINLAIEELQAAGRRARAPSRRGRSTSATGRRCARGRGRACSASRRGGATRSAGSRRGCG